jgi:tRNA A-37 threonylcarbamoyl transferase component Bud32
VSDDLLPELFAQALALDDAARGELVADVRQRDAELAGALERLLASAEGESPLDRSPWRRRVDEVEADRLPSQIGPYRVLAELGRGGMGRVYLAEERREELRRSLAVKVLDRPTFDEDALRRFRDEVRILAALEHPGIARFIDHGRADDGTLYLALEHVEGEDVVRWAARQGLSTRQRVELFVLALEAVAHAHARGVVHRDLKPGHLLVGADGRPRLLDFGISKLVDPETQASVAVTRTDARALTPAYASPEQFRGEVVTPASDVYALGVLLYELLAGSRPFVGTTGSALERAVLEADPEAPSTAARRARGETTRGGSSPIGVPADLDAICLKALRKPPQERYPDAAAMAADLRRWLAGEPVEARRGGRRYRAGRFLARHRWPLAAALSLAVACGALTFAIVGRGGSAVVVAAPMKPSLMSPPPVAELEEALARHPGDLDLGAALVAALSNESRVQEAELALARLKQMPGGADHPVTSWAEAIVATSQGEAQRALAAATAGLSQAEGTCWPRCGWGGRVPFPSSAGRRRRWRSSSVLESRPPPPATTPRWPWCSTISPSSS